MSSPHRHHNTYFPVLQSALPTNRRLIAGSVARSLTLVRNDSDYPDNMIAQQEFTVTEWRVLLLLLDAYPRPAPYDRLLAALHDISLASSRQHLQKADHTGSVRETLRPLRDSISRLRPKLRALSLDIATRQGKGYVMIVQTMLS